MMTNSQLTEVPMIYFEATLYTIGAWTVLRLPDAASKQMPSRGQVFVKGTINGRDLQTVLEPDGNWGHWCKVNQPLRETIGAHAGDTVKLAVAPSKEWPEPVLPRDFIKALAMAPSSVQVLWTKITPMARWEWIRWINATSVTETRARRVEVSISKLRSGKRRPCCFNLAACTDPDLTKNGRLVEPTVLSA